MPTMAVLSITALAAVQNAIPDAVSSASAEASALYRQVLACKEALAKAKPVSDRITGEDAVLCLWSPDAPARHRLARVRGGLSRTPGVTVELRRRNGANSDYLVVQPGGAKVIGIKTNVTGKRVQIGTKRVRVKDERGRWVRKRVPVYRDRAKPVVYVPYSQALHEPAVIRAGFDYVVRKIDEAQDALDALVVRSRTDAALPPEERRLVTEVIPEKVLVTLLVIEHMDPSWVKKDGVPFTDPDWIDPAKLERIVGQVLVTIGLNGEDAYDFSVSDAKASGFAQFIKPTYERIRDAYGEAGLRRDYGDGMRDHLNAMKAQFCLSDWTLKVLKDTAPDAYRLLTDGQHEEDLGAWLAAAYNAGEHRAAPLIRDLPEEWERPRHWWERFRIRSTPQYIAEFRAVYRFLFVHPAP